MLLADLSAEVEEVEKIDWSWTFRLRWGPRTDNRNKSVEASMTDVAIQVSCT